MGPWLMVRRFPLSSTEEETAATAVKLKVAYSRRGGGPLQPPVEDGAWLPTVEDIDYDLQTFFLLVKFFLLENSFCSRCPRRSA